MGAARKIVICVASVVFGFLVSACLCGDPYTWEVEPGHYVTSEAFVLFWGELEVHWAEAEVSAEHVYLTYETDDGTFEAAFSVVDIELLDH